MLKEPEPGPPHEAVTAETDKNTLGLNVTSEPGATTGQGDITQLERK
ncbi:MAG TPA: hypothetical protein VGO47_03800 [Chlamydiales bacterium]|jgi:hypothetical protein|nr:hypothetical protein [Chlamydiales bacterium]